MKKVNGLIFVLMFLMLTGSVLAMSDPVRVKTQPGDWVKIYVRTVGGLSILGLGNGTADSDGIFSYTFFSLNVPNVDFTVFVIRGKEKIRDVEFLGHNTSESLNVDCTGISCEIIDEIVVENETVIVENVTIVENDTVNEGGLRKFLLTGKAIFMNDDGSFDLGFSIGGGVVLLFMFMFMFMIIHRGKKKVSVVDEDDKELEYMDKKVKDTEDKIKKIKEHDVKRKKLEESKARLVADEKELGDLEKRKELLEGGEVEAQGQIEKQESVVERDENEVEKAEDNQQN